MESKRRLPGSSRNQASVLFDRTGGRGTKKAPVWVHFGAGNIFRIFIGGLADRLITQGEMKKGITCVETFDYDVVDKIYDPYDNLGLSVILHGDGTREYKVLGSLAEAVKAQSADPKQWKPVKKDFCK